MDILSKDQLWRCYLKKAGEETDHEPYRLASYLSVIRRSPVQALKEIGACALILALMFGALWLKEILLWVEGAMQ